MAQLKLKHYEAEGGRLPHLCMRCGEPATMVKTRKFSWYPSWVYLLILLHLLIFLIVALIMTKRMTVAVPIPISCEPLAMTTVPSCCIVARAEAGERWAG